MLEGRKVKFVDKQVTMVSIPDFIKESLNKDKNIFVVVPCRLPMIVPPKAYGEGVNGGYLLKDDLETITLIKDKPHYKYKSVIDNANFVYKMVNHISSVPYKINTVLLDFIIERGAELAITISD